MIGPIDVPMLGGPAAELWPVLFDLAEEFPNAWALVGAQMVVLHALDHGVSRPSYTEDADVLVDIRSLAPGRVAAYLTAHGFELDGVSADGVGHRFVREGLAIDVLAIDNAGSRADRTTIPPARTVLVPGGRQAMSHLDMARVVLADGSGDVPVPNWTGALILKSRAALSFAEDQDKHLQDVALLLSLPVDVDGLRRSMSRSERSYVRKALLKLDDRIWRAVGRSIDERIGRAAATLLSG
ncbi:MAG TPA: hypothetical protein VGB52_07030 [Actinomycetota bacterium]